LAALMLLGAALVPTSSADSAPAKPDTRVQQLQDAIGEASAEETAALRELADVRSRRQDLDAAVAGYDRQIGAAEEEIAARQAEIDRIDAKAAALQAQADAARAQLDAAKQRAADAAAAMYRGEDGVAVYAGMLAVDDVYDVFVGTKYLTHVSDRHRKEVESLAGLQQQIESLQQQAAQERAQATAARAAAQQQRDRIAGLREEQQQKRAAIAQEEQHERAIVASIRARKDQFTSELATLQASSNAISQLLVARQRNQPRATSFHVVRPVPGAISEPFGPRVHPILETVRMHTGVDMHAAQGQAIKAGASGVVAFAGVRSGYGNTVIIDHGNQFATLYGHASVLQVRTGQKVGAGQVVALVGATGLATGPHLHFEVRILGTPVNPVTYM
jgi:murein DD-endopeptidase MepM/ murein hydrolase activator NlpD